MNHTQSPHLLADPKTTLTVPQLVASSCVRTPDSSLTVPCPKTPYARIVPQENQQKVEMFLPNEIVGCIIGRGGNKINEIRQTSQATIKISNGEDGTTQRRITITGNPIAVKQAQSMISDSIRLHIHLVALNMAMNRLYASPKKSLGTAFGQIYVPPNPTPCRLSRGVPLSGAGTAFECSIGGALPSFYNPVATPPTHVINQAPGPHSAPAQLGIRGRCEPMTITRTPVAGVSRKNSAITATPYLSTPFLSATRLGSPKQGPNIGMNQIDLMNYSQQQILELIQQFPHGDQQKWLDAIGINVDGCT